MFGNFNAMSQCPIWPVIQSSAAEGRLLPGFLHRLLVVRDSPHSGTTVFHEVDWVVIVKSQFYVTGETDI
jgi:hypothetical protein